ncbi:MAG: type III secretion system gatekeeper subunit SctW [Pseudomonas sp.]|uniref:type III secretion system gatekeeper subunit SctW n=1 Tax=Pseudomonas sp. TaxID=306 RepID=UPI003C71F78E
MKVESHPDLHKIQRLEQPVPEKVAQVRAHVAAPGLDELASAFSREVAFTSKTLNQRSMGVLVTPTEQLAQLYDQLGHPAQASLASITQQARQVLKQQPSVEDLLKLTGGDPARTYVVLRQITAQAEAEARKTEAALARDALARLEMRHKREIQAGLNIAMTLQAASGDPQERQAVRALYYANVVVRQSLSSMMQALLGMYGGERFSDGLNIMRRALADDVAALASSIPTAKLRTLLLGLQSCGQLGGVLSSCHGLIERLKVEHDAVILLQRLLGYAGNGIGASEVQRLAGELAGEEAARQIASLNAIYPVIKSLPMALWRDTRGRQEGLHNFLLVMDEFTRLEKAPARLGAEPRHFV